MNTQKSLLLQASKDYNYNLKILNLLSHNYFSDDQLEMYQNLYYKLSAVNPLGYQNMWKNFIYNPINVFAIYARN